MRSHSTSLPARWAVRLAAFGCVAATAAYAAGNPPPPKLPPGPATAGGQPAPATMLEVRIASLEKSAAADATKISALEKAAAADAARLTALETSLKQLRCDLSCARKCGVAGPGASKVVLEIQILCQQGCAC